MENYKDLEEMTRLEERTLHLIPIGTSRTITTREIANVLGIDKRTVYHLIYRLTTEYGVPVCSSRTGTHLGYYIPENEEQRAKGLQAYNNQITTMLERYTHAVESDIQRTLDYKSGVKRDDE